MQAEDFFKEFLARHPELGCCSESIWAAYLILQKCFQQDHFLFTCGNGGSAADADHIVGEVLKGFLLKRPLLPEQQDFLLAHGQDGAFLAPRLQRGFRAMSLMNQTAIFTAAANDLGGDTGPAQQLMALGRQEDVLLGISTSGNARNISLACQVARLHGMKILGLTGARGGLLAEAADVCIKVPETETYRIQELHLPIYHALCIMVEMTFFEK